MPSALEKWSIQYIIDNCPPELVALSVVVILVAWLTYRVNLWLSGGINIQERLTVTEKQQRKTEQLLEACPCVTKANATWLQDKTRNGGQPPEKICCVYLAAKERGEE